VSVNISLGLIAGYALRDLILEAYKEHEAALLDADA